MSSTKQQITLLADELIRSNGYNAFSYSDISKPLGIKNAAIHYHFPSKPDLALEVVKFHEESFDRFAERVQGKPALSRIKLFLNFYTCRSQIMVEAWLMDTSGGKVELA